MSTNAGNSRKDFSSRGRNVDALFVKANSQWERGRLLSAFRLFLSAAKRGDPSAQVDLGYFYYVGLAVKRNRAAALYWYKRALRHGSRTAASNIASIFRDEGNTKKALSWFQKAVALGDGDANLEIAKIQLREGRAARSVITHLRRTLRAKASDVTEASRAEARRLLKRISRDAGGRRLAARA